MIAWWRRRTVRFRITAAVTVTAIVVLLGITRLIASLIGPVLVDSADTALRHTLDTATDRVEAGATALPAASYHSGLRLRVLDTAGDPLDGGGPPSLSRHDVERLKSGLGVLRTGGVVPHRWLGEVVSAPDGAQRLVAVGSALPGYVQAQHKGLWWLTVAALLGALGAGLAAWFAARTSLRPVRRMRAAARAAGAGGQLGRRLPVPAARDELRGLAEELNTLLHRRDEAIERLRRFTGDAAHELRSPVTSIRAQAEVAVLHPDPRHSAEVLADIAAESERMSTMVSDLLVLARSDAGELPPVDTPDLALAVQAAIAKSPQDAPGVSFEAPLGHCPVLAATAEVSLVLDNLLRNAARHARARVTVTVLPAGRTVRLLVDDDGLGVPREHRSRVFDRFYRVAGDRARGSGGSGLGLALVAELVRRRKGTVRVGESPEGGARFDVRWQAARRLP